MMTQGFRLTRLLAVLALLYVPAAAQDIAPSAQVQIRELLQEKASRTPAQRKMNSNLILAARMQRGQAVTASLQRLPTAVTTVGVDAAGAVEVDVRGAITPALQAFAGQLGGTVLSAFPQWNTMRVRMPLLAVEQLAARGEVTQIQPAALGASHGASAKASTRQLRARTVAQVLGSVMRPPEPMSLARLFTSIGSLFFFAGPDNTGDIAHRANLVRSQLGINGTGVKIGVLSDGVNSLATEVAATRLPNNVTVLSGQAGSGDEGTAMLEIVYTLAPGGQLYFATAQGGPAQMATNITNLAAQGCTVIIDDWTYFDEAPFQDGPVAQAVNTVSGQGVFYFSDMQNSGNLDSGNSGTWEGDFSSGGSTTVGGESGTIHSFGATTYATLTAASQFQWISVKWSDPLGASNNDYDLFILNSTGSAVLASATGVQNGTQDPYEFVNYQSNPSLVPVNSRIVVLNYTGAAAVRALHIDTERGRLSPGTAGASFGHNSPGSGFGVAAINVAQAGGGVFTGGTVETFSSDGPRRMFYNPNGTQIGGGVTFASGGGTLLMKPDVTAADGVPTGVAGFNPFFGTSAAAPHAGAIAALVKQAKPSITLAQMRTALTSTAIDIHAAGWDRDSGYGILNALAAVQSVFTVNVTINANVGSGLAFTVSGTGCAPGSYTTPQTLAWTPGASCSVSFTSQQVLMAGVLYTFNAWADGPAANPRAITAPASAATYTANFTTAYYLSMIANPSNGGTVSPASGYYAAGQVVPIGATANAGFTFSGWTGTGNGSYTGPSGTPSVTMNAPVSETANFTGGGGGYTARVNCGGSVYNDPQGNIWSPDAAIANTSTFFTQNPVRGTDKSYLYQSERFSIGTPFTYTFSSVPNGNYVVRLLFAETYFTSAGQRKFNVALNGTTVLTNYDIVAAAGGSNVANDQVFNLAVSGGTISIQLVPVLSNPKISAIEIVPAATTVTVSPGLSQPMSQPGAGVFTTQQFTATVVGNANTAVNWSLTPNVGTISASGLYTAPAVISNPQRIKVTATSQADASKSASATVQLIPVLFQNAVGTPNLAGNAGIGINAIGVSGSGDVNGTSDSLQLAYSNLTNDGSVIARVNQPYTGSNLNKTGLMMRPGVGATDPHAFMSLFSSIVGLFESRTTTAGATNVQFGAAGVFWMRLLRQGNVFSGYVANDGTNWIPVGTPQTISMPATVNLGMAVSNGFGATLNSATFDNFEFTTSTTAVSINEGLSSLGAGQQAQFTASVTGNANTGVTWSISPAGQGSINASTGLYTAPASITNPSLQTVTVTATSVADPTRSASVVVFLGGFVPVRVNAGGPSHYDPTGVFWSGDSNAVAGQGNVFSAGNTINSTLTPYLYQSERFNASGSLNYKFYVPPGSYTVTLKFAEIYFTTAGSRVMNILINGNTVASNFDIVAQAGANTAIDRQFNAISPVNGAITITLNSVVQAPKVNAIQIQ